MIGTPDETAYEEPDDSTGGNDRYLQYVRSEQELNALGRRVLQVLWDTNDRVAVSIAKAAGISKGRVHHVLAHLINHRVVSIQKSKNGRALKFRNEIPKPTSGRY